MKKKVLLLNPPAPKRFIRDLYCSKLSSGAYYWEPADLIILSALLKDDFYLEVIDAIAENKSFEETLEKIKKERFDIVISLIGSASLGNDLKFLKTLKKKNNLFLAVSGDVALGEAEKVLKRWSFIDACFLDFASPQITKFLTHQMNPQKNQQYGGIIYRNKKGQIIPEKTLLTSAIFEIPIPRHELFPLRKYQLPFFNDNGVATIISSLGCPFKCTFCFSGTLPFRYRSTKSIIKEIKYLISLGIKQFAFRDPLFEANIGRAKEICQLLIKNDLKVHWCCNSRVDTILKDKSLLPIMSKAGCRMILFGVESGDDKILNSVNKGINTFQTKTAFEACRKNEIGTSAYVIIGLPEDDGGTIQKTINFTKKLNPDFAIFSVPSPDYRTELRKYLITQGVVENDINEFDRGGSKKNAIESRHLTAKEILEWQKRAFREFYLRPSYIFTHLPLFLKPRQIKITIKELINLIKNYL